LIAMGKTLSSLIALVLLAAGPRPGSQEKAPDCSNAVTQQEINRCAATDANNAEAEMNKVLEAFTSRHKKDAVFVQRVREAQQAWLRYRDAQLSAQFATAPGESTQVHYGSMYSMCYSNAKAELTRQRTEQLKEMVKSGKGC
jgi:uncharacterized protein YecT (DUF1311 family)